MGKGAAPELDGVCATLLDRLLERWGEIRVLVGRGEPRNASKRVGTYGMSSDGVGLLWELLRVLESLLVILASL